MEQTCQPELTMTPIFCKFEKAEILSKTLFFLMKTTAAHFQYVCTIVQSFRLIARKLWKELIRQTCQPVFTTTQKFSMFEKAVILSKIIFSLSIQQTHIFSMSAAIVQNFKLIA